MSLSDDRRRIAHYVSILCADKQLHPERGRSWNIPSNFKYVILSFKKADVLKQYTWQYLKDCKVPDERIMIVVQNPDCYRDYKAAGFPDASLVQISTVGYADAFNRVFGPATSEHVPLVAVNEVCVQMDDDIVGLSTVGRKTTLSGRSKPMQVVNLDSVMMEQMEIMEAAGCNLGGFVPNVNVDRIYRDALVQRSGDHLALRFVIGQVRIIRNQGLTIQLLNAVGKQDYELTFRYFQRDGGVVRSSTQIRCKRYVGGVNTQGHMEEAIILREHFPREIPTLPKVHCDKTGTTALKLASTKFGQDKMLERLKTKMRELLGVTVCRNVIKQVEIELTTTKKLFDVKNKSRSKLSETQTLPLLRQEYTEMMIERYGSGFDSDSRMVDFPKYILEGWGSSPGTTWTRTRNQDQEDGTHETDAMIKPVQNSALEDDVRMVLAELRSSTCILKFALNMSKEDHMPEKKENGVAAEEEQLTVVASGRRKAVCKICGKCGHYAKTCPQSEAPKEDPYERAERYRANRRDRDSVQKPVHKNIGDSAELAATLGSSASEGTSPAKKLKL